MLAERQHEAAPIGLERRAAPPGSPHGTAPCRAATRIGKVRQGSGHGAERPQPPAIGKRDEQRHALARVAKRIHQRVAAWNRVVASNVELVAVNDVGEDSDRIGLGYPLKPVAFALHQAGEERTGAGDLHAELLQTGREIGQHRRETGGAFPIRPPNTQRAHGRKHARHVAGSIRSPKRTVPGSSTSAVMPP